MSFFDEGDEPQRAPRPRRPVTAPRPAPVDQQTLYVRRALALGGGLLILILLVVGVRGCLNSQKKRSLREYNRNVTELAQESDTNVAKPFFELLAPGTAKQPLDLQTQVNQLRVVADELVKRARKQDVPDDMKAAEQSLVLTLELRRDALGKIAQKIPSVTSRANANDTISQITGQMEALLASDVIYSQRVVPFIAHALDSNDVGGQRIVTSRFLPNLTWLDETTVAQRLGASISGSRGGPVAPGLHGHGLVSVSVGNQALTPDAANHIPAGASLSFDVKFQNQGENDESNVIVKLSIEGAGKAIRVQRTVATTKAGAETTVTLPLGQAPPIGTPVTINVAVQAVPGEKKTDNNKQSYPALFTA